MASVQMPRLSDSMETGKILRWLKKEGEQVQKGEPLVEIESDKANIEVEAYASGKLSKILVPEGESAPIGAVIAEIGDASAAPAAQQAPAPPEAAAPQPQASKPEAHVAQAEKAVAATAQAAADAGGEQYPHGGPDDRTEVGAAAQAALNVIRRPAEQENGERQRVSPVARRLAEEHGVDLRRVQGSGPGGRITKEDVEAAAQLKTQPQAAPAAATAAREARPATARPTSEAISINDLIVKAVALALTKFPEVNASWADGRIERKRDINIGIAVGLPDRLIVPVLHNADQKPLKEIAKESKQLIERSRANKASAQDYVGNTFSISNLGMYDVDQFTAIINPPDSGILAIGSIEDKAVVKDGQVVPGKRMRVTLSVDHRVFYGVTAAQFLQEVKRLLQSPMALVL